MSINHWCAFISHWRFHCDHKTRVRRDSNIHASFTFLFHSFPRKKNTLWDQREIRACVALLIETNDIPHSPTQGFNNSSATGASITVFFLAENLFSWEVTGVFFQLCYESLGKLAPWLDWSVMSLHKQTVSNRT